VLNQIHFQLTTPSFSYPELRLKIDIQQRYALPFSCVVFAIFGSALACTRIKINSLTLALIAIGLYQIVQFLSVSFAISGVLPIFFGVWLPNILGLLGSVMVLNFNQ